MDYGGYWNPSEGTLAVRTALEEAAKDELQFILLNEASAPLAELNKVIVAILHRPMPFDNARGGWEQADRAWFCNPANNTRGGLVTIHISTEPITDPPQRIELEDGGVRYVLPVRNTIAAELAVTDTVDHMRAVEQWRRLLSAIRDRQALDCWLQQQTRHPDLDEFFSEKPLEWLPALAILCQGYLVVHAEQNADGDWGPPAIAAALQQMGWAGVMEDGSVREVICRDLDKKRGEVAKTEWWHSLFELEGLSIAEEGSKPLQERIEAFIRERIEDEWRAGDEADIEPVRKLIRRLGNENERLENPDLGLVATAYCEITKKLGGQPCTP